MSCGAKNQIGAVAPSMSYLPFNLIYLFWNVLAYNYNFIIRHNKDFGPTLFGPLMDDLHNGIKIKGQISVHIFDISFKSLIYC